MNQQHIRQLEAGDVLFREGETADCAFIVEAGQLEISINTHGQRSIIRHVGQGGIVGELGFFTNARQTATAMALEPTRLTTISREQLTERVSQADPILKLLVKMLLDRQPGGHRSVLAGDQPSLLPEEIVGEYLDHGVDRIRLEAELRDALGKEQLEVCYQPMLELDQGRIAGFEALIRWQHPERGMLSADLFISLAEETRLIVPVGLYVFERACRQLLVFDQAAQKNSADRPLFMSINVSTRQISDPEFIEQAAALTRELGVSTRQIKLEITETLTADLEQARRFTRRCKALGFSVALDDFGTGYSSLSTLSRLDIDTVKIDQSFVQPIRHHPRGRDLLRGIVDLARNLDFETVIEGIETEHQLAFVEGLGCDYAQGYFIGRSLSVDQVLSLLSKSPIGITD